MKKINEKQLQDNTKLLIEASEKGNVELIKQLIPVSDPHWYDSRALLKASEHGHAECVKLLIPVSNPKTLNSVALLAL